MTNQTYKCRHCEQVKPITDYYMDRGRHETRCKDCSKVYSAGLRRIKKVALPKPHSCDMCGEHTALFMDHNRKTEKFRGWLCRNCNAAIGFSGDDIKGVLNALTYLVERG